MFVLMFDTVKCFASVQKTIGTSRPLIELNWDFMLNIVYTYLLYNYEFISVISFILISQ